MVSLKKLTCVIFLLSLHHGFAEQICVVGTGYVGLVTGVGLASLGHTVCCVDIIAEKIAQLRAGKSPIYEPGLDDLMQQVVTAGRLTFSADVNAIVRQASVIFIVVGTPMAEDGSTDLRALEVVFNGIAENIKEHKVICIKSTVPVGTGRRMEQLLLNNGVPQNLFDIVSNPEFLREGSAVSDFLNPDRIVIGGEATATAVIRNLYQPLIDKGFACLVTTRESSELIKYASNAMLATRVAFINEIARLCNRVGANVHDVAKGMGFDKRIGPAFLRPGPGFGGSCFPKDTKALEYMMNMHRVGSKIISHIFSSNAMHKAKILKDMARLLGKNCSGKKIALLGLTFKANTDDVRDSFSLDAIKYFLELGVTVNAYDPYGMENAKKIFPQITYCKSALVAIEGVDLIIIATEWDEFKHLDLAMCAQRCCTKAIADLRNLFDPRELQRCGFVWYNLGYSY